MKCPLCGSASTPAFRIKGFAVLDCAECKHRFAGVDADERHVNATYDDTYFNGGGAGYTDYAAEAEMLEARGRMYADKVAAYTTPGTVLDVGAAAGYILKGFTDSGWSGAGIEPNHAMAAFGRERLGLDIRQGSLESFETARRFDLISMIQVAAHFYDPALAFRRAYDMLEPSGLLLIETWDRSSFSARLFGRHWHEYSPPSVLHWFSRSGLASYLDSAGFERVAGGRPPKNISGGHLVSLLKYRLGDNLLLKAIPKNINFPYPSEDLFWALFKKR